MKTTRFFQISVLTALAALLMIGCISTQNAQTMNDNKRKPNPTGNVNSAQPGSGQTVSSSMNSNTNVSATSGLAKYQDKKIDSLPTKSVSLKYVVEHRTALSDQTITVSGIVVSVGQQPSGNSTTGVRSMANPQPRIFIADSSKDSRDKNRDVMVIVEAGDNYTVGQKVNFKVKVSGSKVAVMLRKVS